MPSKLLMKKLNSYHCLPFF